MYFFFKIDSHEIRRCMFWYALKLMFYQYNFYEFVLHLQTKVELIKKKTNGVLN